MSLAFLAFDIVLLVTCGDCVWCLPLVVDVSLVVGLTIFLYDITLVLSLQVFSVVASECGGVASMSIDVTFAAMGYLLFSVSLMSSSSMGVPFGSEEICLWPYW